MIKARANAGFGLIGQPSDIFNGKVIAGTISDLSVESIIRESDDFKFSFNNYSSDELDSIGETVNNYLSDNGMIINPYEFSAVSKIPKNGCLGSNTALISCLLGSINKLFYLSLSNSDIAYHTTMIERKLGFNAGFMNSFVIVNGGLNFIDFSGNDYKKFLIEKVPLSVPLWIAVRSKSVGFYDIHKAAVNSYPKNKELQDVVLKLGDCAFNAKTSLSSSSFAQQALLHDKYLQSIPSSEDVNIQRLVDGALLSFCKQRNTPACLTGVNGSLVVMGDKPDFLREFRLSSELSSKASRFGLRMGERLINDVIPLRIGEGLKIF